MGAVAVSAASGSTRPQAQADAAAWGRQRCLRLPDDDSAATGPLQLADERGTTRPTSSVDLQSGSSLDTRDLLSHVADSVAGSATARNTNAIVLSVRERGALGWPRGRPRLRGGGVLPRARCGVGAPSMRGPVTPRAAVSSRLLEVWVCLLRPESVGRRTVRPDRAGRAGRVNMRGTATRPTSARAACSSRSPSRAWPPAAARRSTWAPAAATRGSTCSASTPTGSWSPRRPRRSSAWPPRASRSMCSVRSAGTDSR